MTAPLIELSEIEYTYLGGDKVLNGLNFSLNTGEKIGLVGHNGSGKTTLLQIAMGLLKPDTGEVRLFGNEMADSKNFEKSRLRVGFLFQNADDQLFNPTVLDDVAFGPLNQGLGRDEAREVAISTLDKLGLAGFEDRVPHRLSGGEKKLVALATIMAMNPEVLLLDEPTTGLDLDTKARIQDILCNLDIAMTVVSHEPDFMAATTNKIMALKNGTIHKDGVKPHTHVHIHEHGDLPHTHES